MHVHVTVVCSSFHTPWEASSSRQLMICLSLQPDHSVLVSEPIVEERSARLEYRLDTRKMDPQKAKQAERLGMGVASRRYLLSAYGV